VSPVKNLSDGRALRHLGLKDKSGLAKVCLFEETAERDYEPDDVVQVTNVYKKQYLGVFLNTKRGSEADVSKQFFSLKNYE